MDTLFILLLSSFSLPAVILFETGTIIHIYKEEWSDEPLGKS